MSAESGPGKPPHKKKFTRRKSKSDWIWVSDANAVMLTDFYELTMLASYFAHGMNGDAVFDLFVRRLPATRNYLVACGLEDVLHYLETFSFSDDDLSYLRSLNRFPSTFLDYLKQLRFTGDVYAVAEGSVVFANEPIIEIIAPLPQAQLVETFLINQIHFQTMAASKAARIVAAARGRRVVDYGLRRIHGADAGLKAARAFYIAGVDATSNVLAGKAYGVPASGTMAHSFVQAHDSEYEAFQQFLESFPEGALLVDTYDTVGGVKTVIRLARDMGARFRAIGVRLDSGDLGELSKTARRLLNDAGLRNVQIFASSSIDEYLIENLLAASAPIDGFGVGTHMGVSADAPFLDAAYKLVEYSGTPRMKLSAEKTVLPGRKQIFRQYTAGRAAEDLIATFGEDLQGKPLLKPVMLGGRRTGLAPSLEEIRAICRSEVESLPEGLRSLKPAGSPYPVRPTDRLFALEAECRRMLQA